MGIEFRYPLAVRYLAERLCVAVLCPAQALEPSQLGDRRRDQRRCVDSRISLKT